MNTRLFSFVGGAVRGWTVLRATAVKGASLPAVSHLSVSAGASTVPAEGCVLRGVTSHERYATRAEHDHLAAASPVLGRADLVADCVRHPSGTASSAKSTSDWPAADSADRPLYQTVARLAGARKQ
jgi:hypothetical protein